MDFLGYLIGGFVVGEIYDEMNVVFDFIVLMFLNDKFCYLMGVGVLDSLIDVVI